MEPPSKSADMCNTMHEEEEDEVLEAKHGVSEARIHCPARAAHYLGKIIKLEFKLSTTFKPDIPDQCQIYRLTPQEAEDFKMTTPISLAKMDNGIKDQVRNLSKALTIIKACKGRLNSSFED